MPRPLTLICAAALAFAAATPVFADDVQQEVVRFSDLDLNDPHDANELIQRLQAASGRVCGARTGPQPVAQWADDRDCMLETTELAVRDVGHPIVLGEYYGVYPRVIVEEGDAGDPYWDDGYVTVKKPIK